MRLVVAGQHQARRPAARDERAVDAVDEAGAVQVLVKRVQYRFGDLRMVAEGLGPRVEPGGAAELHLTHAPDGLREHGGRDALGLSLQQAHDERPADALTIEMAPI